MFGNQVFNESFGNQAANVEAVQATAVALESLGARATEMAIRLRSDPTQLKAMAGRCRLLGQEFSDVVSSASDFEESRKRLHEKMTEMTKAPSESGSSVPNDGGLTQTIHVDNVFGRMCDFS